jgi:hypothetical protein
MSLRAPIHARWPTAEERGDRAPSQGIGGAIAIAHNGQVDL